MCMHVGMDVLSVCYRLVIIKHQDAGAGTELWCDEVKQQKWSGKTAAETAKDFSPQICNMAVT